MSMKSRIKIIVSLAAALLAAGIVAYILYGKRADEWRQVAGQTLRNAVGEEVAKRIGQPFYLATDGSDKQLEERDFPKKVHLDMESGSKEYEISYFQNIHNITESPNDRVVHTYWLQEQPLEADTLGRAWNDSLREAGFQGDGLLRINTMNVETGQRCTTYWTDSAALAKADSLSCLFIGYACETEIVGYLSCPWWRLYALSDWEILLLAGMCTFFFLMWLVRRRAISRLHPAMDVADGCCCLSDGTMFYREKNILQKNENQVELSATIARLLIVLIEANGGEVSNRVLIEKVWPSHSGSKEQLRKAIERLRKLLHSIASEVVIENGWGTYRLK